MQKYTRQFIDEGFTTVPFTNELADWVETTKQRADAWVSGNRPKEKGWYDNGTFDVPPIPVIPDLVSLLGQVLTSWNGDLGTCAQLSSIVEGYGTPGSLNRHVDGANGELAWAGLLLGIHLQEIPSNESVGTLVVWPGSHRETQTRFDRLGPSPSVADVQQAIGTRSGCDNPQQVDGPAGTVVLIDHRLEHAIAAHRKVDFTRHVTYFRLPRYTSVPAEVVNAKHFLKNG
jgi:hypothetical protein